MLQVRAYGRQIMDELEVGLSSAWWGAGFARMNRLPDLEKFLSRRKSGRAQIDRAFTAAEARRWARLLSERKATGEESGVIRG